MRFVPTLIGVIGGGIIAALVVPKLGLPSSENGIGVDDGAIWLTVTGIVIAANKYIPSPF